MFTYRLVCLESAAMPDGRPAWRYVIANAFASIAGCRCGAEAEVAAFARRCAERLNAAHAVRPGWHARAAGAAVER